VTTSPATGPAAPAPHAGAAPWLRTVLAQTGMELKLLVRSGESLLVTFGIPLGILLFFSVVDVLPTGEGDPVEFLVPGVLAISVMSTAFVAQAIQTAFERKYGVLKRLGGTPLTRSRFLVAKSLAVLTLVAVQTALVLAIARFGLGWSPAAGAGGAATTDVALVVGAMLLGTAAFTALGLLLAGALRAEATLALTNALYLLLLLVSGLTIDLDSLPGPLARASTFLPSGALGVLLRDGLTPEEVALRGLAGAVLALWTVAAVALAARTFRWEP
jgi:ABC-2 type transport system permease protein